jgi:hypothetical protein
MVRGTLKFGEEGPEDPSGLYWLPSNPADVQKRLRAIRGIALWMREEASSGAVPRPLDGIPAGSRAAARKHILMNPLLNPIHDLRCLHSPGRSIAETDGLFQTISFRRLRN